MCFKNNAVDKRHCKLCVLTKFHVAVAYKKIKLTIGKGHQMGPSMSHPLISGAEGRVLDFFMCCQYMQAIVCLQSLLSSSHQLCEC